MMADSILTKAAPFPGDELFYTLDLRPELWFYILHDTKTPNYILNDWLTCSQTEIAWHVIEDPTFDMSYWYAEIQSEMLGFTERILHHHCMGNAITMVAMKLLMDTIASSYQCTNWLVIPRKRFSMEPEPSEPSSPPKKYILKDLDLKIDVPIPKIWLEDPTFDLVSWY